MTTEAAAALYLAQHNMDMEGRRIAFWNPHGKPWDELPVIYGFNNGGSRGWYQAVALSQDGVCVGGHCCSHEFYMMGDLGILEGTRDDRHKNDYQKHYPDGYRMEWVPSDKLNHHPGLAAALAANKARSEASASGEKHGD